MANKFFRDYLIIAILSLVFGVIVILIPVLFPAVLRWEENVVSNSMFEFYYLYLPFYIFFLGKLFKEGMHMHSGLSFLSRSLIGTIFYTLGLFLALSQFNVNNLMMG